MLNFIFLFEFVVKSIAMSFITEPESYLRDTWNQIDLMLILISFSDFLNDDKLKFFKVKYNFIKALRVVRFLKAIRLITKIGGIRSLI